MPYRYAQAIPILMYHSISHQATARFAPFVVTPEAFEEQMRFVHQQGYHALTVTQFARLRREGQPLPARSIIITFDDGFADFLTVALPVLQRYDLVATLYVPTAFVGATSRWMDSQGEGTRPLLTWEQLRLLPTHGIECGAHSHTHPQLDLLSLEQATHEIVSSKHLLEEQLGIPVTSFAYPHGYSTRAIQRVVRQAGYTSACAVGYEMANINDDVFALPRLRMGQDIDLAALRTLLALPCPPPLLKLYKQMRVPLWRLLRRYRQHSSSHKGGGEAIVQSAQTDRERASHPSHSP